MFKLWQRGKEIRSDCSNKKRTHHQTELTFKMRLLLIATSLALAAVSDALETHFPLQINFLNPNTIQGGPTQRGPSKVASSSREGSLQIQTKIARGINLVFWQQLLKVAGPTAPDIMTQNISQGGIWNSISAPDSTKTIWVQVMRFSNFTKPDLVLCLYMICAHITGRETRALQRSAALKIQMELKTGEHQKASLYKWWEGNFQNTFLCSFLDQSSWVLPSDSLQILVKLNTALFPSAHLSVPRHTPYFFSRYPFLFFFSSPNVFLFFHVCISFSFADQMCPFSK